MTDTERRLSQLLHEETPQPPRLVSAAEVARAANAPLATIGSDETSSRHPLRGWLIPLAAAAVVAAGIAVPVTLAHRDSGGSPPGNGVVTPPVTSLSVAPPPRTTVPSTVPSSAPSRAGASSTAGTHVAGPPASHSGTGVATCATANLQLVIGGSQGAAGSLYTTLYLVNRGRTTCALQGYPGVALLDGTGAIVGHPAVRSGAPGAQVLVSPGQRGQFVIQIGDVTTIGCNLPKPSTQIQVYPPDQTVAIREPMTAGSCELSVRAIQPAG